jgi:hypothetical protein
VGWKTIRPSLRSCMFFSFPPPYMSNPQWLTGLKKEEEMRREWCQICAWKKERKNTPGTGQQNDLC